MVQSRSYMYTHYLIVVIPIVQSCSDHNISASETFSGDIEDLY